jgi:hypothetical protein
LDESEQRPKRESGRGTAAPLTTERLHWRRAHARSGRAPSVSASERFALASARRSDSAASSGARRLVVVRSGRLFLGPRRARSEGESSNAALRAPRNPQCPVAWNSKATTAVPPFRGCRSEAGADRALPDAWSSSQAGVSGDRAETLARRGRRALWRSRGPPPMPVACVSIRRPPAERTNCGAPLERPAGQSKADRLSAFTRRSPAA